MKIIKYFFQFLIVFLLFIIFKILGYKLASKFGSFLGKKFGKLIRSKKIIFQNLSYINKWSQKITKNENNIADDVYSNYGRILSEYVFLDKFRNGNLKKNVTVIGGNYLEQIRSKNKSVVFVPGHFNNFELMAMHLEKSGIDLAAIYRPLNNLFLNPIIENIRKKYICKKQIKKGISGTKELLKEFKNGTSIALMIDQRVSEGIKSDLFGKEALTTTIPAQFIKKFNVIVVPIYIERTDNDDFKLNIYENIQFSKEDSIASITLKLNKILEKMIALNPDQWIWTHNRWKI